jgi:hypothetical protein
MKLTINIDTKTITSKLHTLADTTPREAYNASKAVATKLTTTITNPLNKGE